MSNVPGFYVAHHRWFDFEAGPDALYKVGHTGDLRRRLTDGAYVTCFPGGFSYVFTVETPTKADAFRLETGVLHCAAARRVGRGDGPAAELVRMGRAELFALARAVAARLGIAGIRVRDGPPAYPRPAPRGAEPAGGGPEAAAPLVAAAELASLAGLVVAAGARPPRAQAEPLLLPRKTVDDYLREARTALAEEEAEIAEEETAAEAEAASASAAAAASASASASATAARRRAPAGGGDDEAEEEDFADTLVGDVYDMGARESGAAPYEERAYQTEAVAACLAELSRGGGGGRAILQMACRCGKTRVAHGVMRDYLARPRPGGRARVLYLVPGLALMRQTAQKLDHYGLDAEALLVGSDDRPLPALVSLRPAAGSPGAAVAGTTDPAEIARVCAAGGARPLVVIATYQSSPLLPDVFDLTVFDESHRVCGALRDRPFTRVLLTHAAGDRLYMTATPRYDAPLSMKDRAHFGGVAFAYHMREGIDAGYVNAFSLELVGRPRAGPAGAAGAAADREATPGQVAAALGRLGPAGKLLVFCRSIRHASELCAAVATELCAAPRAAGTGDAEAPVCLCAHSRMARADIAANLARFCAPGGPAVLFNCRLFQEGVEIPALNGVFFASPRHSPRDIIQSLCRPLNVLPGKPPSKIFIPVAYDPAAPPDAPANLERFASIVPFFDALVAEDPLLYEHLLDPAGTPYPLRWVDSAAGGAGAAPAVGRYEPARLLAAARRAVRRGGAGKAERLLRAARIPWTIGFGELRRIVVDCGRYPKTTDCFVYGDAKVNFGQFYHYVRGAYAKWRAGEAQPLEPHQLRALESLPGWEVYGLEGPYPWRETLAYLEQWLADHDGVPPMVEINCGGYVGLEATPMERLSGTLTCVNQSDGRDRKARDGPSRPGSGFTLDPAKRADLDALCARWGLRWRKERLPAPAGAPAGSVGSLVADEKGEYAGPRTFIQEAYARFKAEWGRAGKQSAYVSEHYPGFPHKHRTQERPDVWARRKEVVPPRWRGRGRDSRAGARPPA